MTTSPTSLTPAPSLASVIREGKPVIDAVLASLVAAGIYNRNDQVAPAAILWTDKERQWETLLPALREHLPQLLTLGDYEPATRTGPAIWLKCMIARTLPEADWAEDITPILYLPGISHADLRAVEECPRPLQPLAELQYRGTYWTQVNGKDWTLLAFLSSNDGGLGLDVARDAATSEAMRRALFRIAETPISSLCGKRLEAADFDFLLAPDPPRDLLTWLDDPAAARNRMESGKWEAFRAVCRQTYAFDPQTDGDLVGAERLGGGEGAWRAVWTRFAEAPRRYPKLPALLRRANPKPATSSGGLFVSSKSNARFPQDNEALETELRSALRALSTLTPAEAAQRIVELEAQHGERRAWVWAELGEAPLAQALYFLSTLAEITRQQVSGSTPDEMANSYTNTGWRADEATLDCLSGVKSAEDVKAVHCAIRAVYLPWLEQSALRFQSLVKTHPLPTSKTISATAEKPEAGCVILFADGLRYDTGQKFKSAMISRDWKISERWHWVALPSVTPTAKPAVSPIADALAATTEGEEFRPLIAGTNDLLTTYRFRALMQERGFQILASNDVGDANGAAWTEIGDLDSYGHEQGWKLARRVGEVIDEMIERLAALIAAGWQKIRIVTDHGWLLMPGNLPKTEMPGFLAETRWGRCAVLKETSIVETQIVPWHWSADVRIAVAPGINVFKNGLEYAHGGLSLQECVATEFIVTSDRASAPQAIIIGIEWVGFRCRVRVEGETNNLRVGLRTKASDASTSIAAPKEVTGGKPTSLVVEDDSLEGTAAIVVLLGADDLVIGKQATTVGE